MTVWFSDLTQVDAPTPYCLVCWAYGGLILTHGETS